jgi:hypothetical protein
LDRREYPTGKKVTDEQMASLNIERNDFRGEWNYKISPRQLKLVGIQQFYDRSSSKQT